MAYKEKFQIVINESEGKLRIIEIEGVSEYKTREEAESKCIELQKISLLARCYVISLLEWIKLDEPHLP